MKRSLVTLMSCALLALPMSLGAAEHEHGGHAMEGGSHASMQMMNGDSIMLGEQNVDGVNGMAHLNDVGEVMAKMGKKENYHFMAMFSDGQSGDAINEGTVAVKIIDPSGQTGAPVVLMGMGGHFGADVALTAKGEYRFLVGTKLADGKKRQYTFSYTLK